MGTSLSAIPRMLSVAGRLLLAHWPEFLVLAFLGMAMREASIWAAVELSDWNSFAAQLLLIFAPLGYLLPVIAMLHRCRGSLPRARATDMLHGPDSPTEGRERRLVDVMVSVLIAFLTVYAALGLHDQDFHRFTNAAAADEITQMADANFIERIGFYDLRIVAAIVVVSWLVRWSLGWLERSTGLLLLAFVGAGVEIYYTGQLVVQVMSGWLQVKEWWSSRQLVVSISDGYQAVLDFVGPFAGPLGDVVDGGWWVVNSLGMIVLVPAAWLTVAAIVLGHKLIPAPKLDDHQQGKVASTVMNIGETFFDDVLDRLMAFWYGVRMVFAAGFVQVAVFSAIFLVAARCSYWLSGVVRQVVGPVDTSTYLSFGLIEEALGLAGSMVLIAPLLAAATEVLVLPATRPAEPRTPEPGPRAPTPSTPATPR